MYRFTIIALGMALAAGCASGTQSDQMDFTIVHQDFSTDDAEQPDLSTDDAETPDLSQTPDLTATPDLTMAGGDAAGPADMAGVDLTTVGDMVAGKPDFAKPKDAAAGDLKTTADLAVTDAGLPVPGMQLVNANVSLVGVTADGYAVYANLDKDEVDVIALATGSMPSTIASPASTSDVSIDGKTVFVWTGVSTTTGVGGLTVWTKANGAKTATKSIAGLAAATADGASVIYTSGANTAGTTATLNLAASTLASPVALIATLNYPQGSATTCFPNIGFVGTTAIASHCAASMTAATVSTYDATGKATDLITGGADFWDTDKAGDKVLIATAAGTLQVTVPAGGTPTTIDTAVSSAFMVADGTATIYTTTAGALKRSVLTAPSPKTLVTANATGLIAAASDASYVVFYNKASTTTGYSDLQLASGTAAGSATTLTSVTTGAIFGSAFTADNLHALYYTSVNATNATGTFKTMAVAGGSSSTIGSLAWFDIAATGSKLVYNDNFSATGGVRGRADLNSVDATTPTAPKMIVPAADVDFDLDPTKANVVFTLSQPGRAGLYVTAIP